MDLLPKSCSGVVSRGEPHGAQSQELFAILGDVVGGVQHLLIKEEHLQAVAQTFDSLTGQVASRGWEWWRWQQIPQMLGLLCCQPFRHPEELHKMTVLSCVNRNATNEWCVEIRANPF